MMVGLLVLFFVVGLLYKVESDPFSLLLKMGFYFILD